MNQVSPQLGAIPPGTPPNCRISLTEFLRLGPLPIVTFPYWVLCTWTRPLLQYFPIGGELS